MAARELSLGAAAARVVVPLLAFVLVVNLIWGDRVEPDPFKRISNATACRRYGAAKQEYAALLGHDRYDLALHRGYLECHFAEPKHTGKSHVRDDSPVIAEYQGLAASADPALADIGRYGLGFASSRQEDYARALEWFARVRNRSMRYLNNSTGYALNRLGRELEAEACFRREIELGGNLDGAYGNLADLLLKLRRMAELRNLVAAPGAAEHLPDRVMRFLALDAGSLGRYVWLVIRDHRPDALGAVAALLLLAAWLLVLRRIDAFEPEPARFVMLALAGGMVCSLLTIPLYDLAELVLRLRLEGRILPDLAYCVLVIGLIEEAAKLAPVLLILWLTRAVDESVDYFIYASLTGLAFAFMENLLYFRAGGLASIVGRGLTAVPLHMALTSLAIYGLFFARYRQRRFPGLWLALSFAAACVLHGLYDFWLVSEAAAGELAVMSTVLLVYALLAYRVAVLCALNLSEYAPARPTSIHLMSGLCVSIGLAFALEYGIVAFRYGVSNANLTLLRDAMSSIYVILVLAAAFGSLTPQHNKWESLRQLFRRKAARPEPATPA